MAHTRKQYRSLADYLARTHTTQEMFAARLGTRQSVISRYVRGKAEPSLRMACRIADAARIPIRSLVADGGTR